MQCGASGVDPAACLSAPQAQALRTAMPGRFKTTGEQIALGYPSEALGGSFFPSSTTSPDTPQGSSPGSS
jgi:hypothetical protein